MSKLVLQTAAADRPIRTEEAADHLRETDSARLAEISRLVDAAVATLQARYWVQFCTATYDQYFDGWPAARFLLERNPALTVASVKYTNTSGVETTVATSVWEQADELGRGIVRLKYNQQWPSDLRGHADDIVIRYSCGYGLPAAVPAPIKQALLLVVADMYTFRESVSPLRLEKVPQAVDALMAGYTFRTVG